MRSEIWKDIPEYEGLYQVSDTGRVKSFKRNPEKILNLYNDKYGYLYVGLRNKNKIYKKFKVHRLVMLTFCSELYFEGAQINHINGIKTDNTVCNLEWCTNIKNIEHACMTGLHNNKGINNKSSKLDDDQVRTIRSLYNDEHNTIHQLSKIFNVSKPSIYRIVTNRSWSHI